MRRTEEQHNSPEQVSDYLSTALAIVAEVDPPEDLRGVVLAKAIDLVSGKQIFWEQVPSIPGLSIQ